MRKDLFLRARCSTWNNSCRIVLDNAAVRYVLDLIGLSAGAVGDVASARVRELRAGDEVEVHTSCAGTGMELLKRQHRGELSVVESSGRAPQLRFRLKRP